MTAASDPVTFDQATRELLDGKSFATIATLNPDGAPQTSVVWIDREGDTVVFSATRNRQKVRNLARDPRVSLTVFDPANPYQSVEIRGAAELIDDPDKALPLRLSHKYLGQDPMPEPAQIRRVVVKVTPHKVNSFSA